MKRIKITIIRILPVGLMLITGCIKQRHFQNIANLAEISKQHPTVQNFLEVYPDAIYKISRAYLTSQGSVYQLDENWKIIDDSASSAGGTPIDGKDHYCWVVHWYDQHRGVEHIVDVYIDRNTYKIVFVLEAW